MSLKQLLTSFFKKPEAPKETHKKEAEYIPELLAKTLPGKDGNKPNNYKFTEEEKQLMVAWFATGLTPTEVSERAKEELNLDVSHNQVYLYTRAEKWQPLIKKIRQETMNDITAVSGSHKRVRLERHEKVFEKALKKGDLKNAVSATEHQRKEMEGAGDMVNLTLNQFNVLSDDELEFKKKEVLERIKLIESQKEKK